MRVREYFLLNVEKGSYVQISEISLSCLGVTEYGNFSVEVIDPVPDLELMEVRKKKSSHLFL